MRALLFISALCSIFKTTLVRKAVDLVHISCNGDHTDKILYHYSTRNKEKGMGIPQSLEYEARDTIDGVLAQNIRINGTGPCFHLVIRMRCAFLKKTFNYYSKKFI